MLAKKSCWHKNKLFAFSQTPPPWSSFLKNYGVSTGNLFQDPSHKIGQTFLNNDVIYVILPVYTITMHKVQKLSPRQYIRTFNWALVFPFSWVRIVVGNSTRTYCPEQSSSQEYTNSLQH